MKILYCVTALYILSASSSAKPCYQCATPNLENNWYLTGFPSNTPPKDMIFSSNCYNSPLNTTECAGICLEMTFVIDGAVEAARGCYEKMVDSNDIKDPDAHCNTFKNTQTIGQETKALTLGVRTCTSNETVEETGETIPCNNALRDNTALLSKDCPANSNTKITNKCIVCSSYDGAQSCYNYKEESKQTIGNSQICKKIDGYLGGRYYIERDVSPISPIFVDYCFNVNFDVVAFRSGGNATVTRSKRDVKQTLKASICYCTSDMCNSSNDLQSAFMKIVTVFIALVSTINFF